MRATDFHDLVSGRRRGVGPAMLRAALATAEGPYRLGVWWRNRRYDTRPELTHRVSAPVVSVGNLTLGGTGKTPMVKWIARRLRDRDVRVSILSRGYGAGEEGVNDEALELEHALPDVPHLQNPDRVASAEVAIDELAAQVLLLDDGFQHRRLARDLDIVLLDATEPFGYGRVFPRGALREGIRSLRRADVVCLTRADRIDERQREEIRNRVLGVAPEAHWCESVAQPCALLRSDENGDPIEESLDSIRGSRALVFCGIGNPNAFRATVESLGATVVSLQEFPDHHRYSADDVRSLSQLAETEGVDCVLCTHKDLVKVAVPGLGGRPLRAVEIRSEILRGSDQLGGMIDKIAELGLRSTEPIADPSEKP